MGGLYVYTGDYVSPSRSLVLAWPNRIDEAVLSSAGAWQATLPLANLQDRVLATVARSNMILAVDPDIVMDLGQARRIGVLALVAHNLSVGATVRVLADEAGDFATPIYDSGFLAVWPAGMLPPELLEWEDDNFWLGTVSAEVRAGYRAPYIHLLPASQIARYWKVVLHDPVNPDGYLQLGRLFISETWQPEVNFSQGAQLGFEDRSVALESLGGTEFFDQRAKYRVQRLALNWLSENEAYSRMLEMQRQLGQTGELLVIPDPSDLANMPQRAFLGRVQRLVPVERGTPGVYRSVVDIKEIL